MSLREKSAWICLITTLAIFVPYFVYVFRLIAQPDLAAPDIVTVLVAAIALQTAANVADERDAAIDSRSRQGA